MSEDEINYRFLRKIEQMEKNSPVLSKIRSDFYSSLRQYSNELETRHKKEENSQKKMLMKDELESIKKLSLNIYELREKKILLAVVSRARGGNPDTNNMTNSEKELFDNILKTVLKHRNNKIENKKAEDNYTENENNSAKTTEDKKEIAVDEQNNNILKINKDMPEFIGTDEKKYFLRKNDIITMSADMSEMLIKRGVAETVNQLA